MDIPRKKSPRAPSMALDEGLQRALNAYEKERLHATPADVFAQHIGYKDANNGSALQAIASLRYYGLIDRPREGMLAISKDVESYKYAPDDHLRSELLLKFLRTPPVFAELLDKYQDGLPSDPNLRHELITQRGFTPPAAEVALKVFKRSVQFVDYYSKHKESAPAPMDEEAAEGSSISPQEAAPARVVSGSPPRSEAEVSGSEDVDRIPVRLPGGRRAWLVIPVPFFQSDKERLKAQIDLLLASDEHGAA